MYEKSHDYKLRICTYLYFTHHHLGFGLLLHQVPHVLLEFFLILEMLPRLLPLLLLSKQKLRLKLLEGSGFSSLSVKNCESKQHDSLPLLTDLDLDASSCCACCLVIASRFFVTSGSFRLTLIMLWIIWCWSCSCWLIYKIQRGKINNYINKAHVVVTGRKQTMSLV